MSDPQERHECRYCGGKLTIHNYGTDSICQTCLDGIEDTSKPVYEPPYPPVED